MNCPFCKMELKEEVNRCPKCNKLLTDIKRREIEIKIHQDRFGVIPTHRTL